MYIVTNKTCLILCLSHSILLMSFEFQITNNLMSKIDKKKYYCLRTNQHINLQLVKIFTIKQPYESEPACQPNYAMT